MRPVYDLTRIEVGEMMDGKTIMLLQYAQLHGLVG